MIREINDKDATIILNGFFKLPNLQKLQVVNAINEYFDELDRREEIRSEHSKQYAALGVAENSVECICCGRK